MIHSSALEWNEALPGSQSELRNEDVTALVKDHGCIRTDHFGLENFVRVCGGARWYKSQILY